MFKFARTVVHRAGKHRKPGNSLIEHARLENYLRTGVGYFHYGVAKIAHSPGDTAKRNIQVEQAAQQTEKQRRRKQLKRAQPAGLERHQLSVGTHTQKSQKHAEHAGNGYYQGEKKRTQVYEKCRHIERIQVETQKQLA